MTILKTHFFLFSTFIFFCLNAKGQKDTLPDFAVKNINGSIEINWHNPYRNSIQINIQRSKEASKNFITIHSTPDPTAKYYRYTDKTAPHDTAYYRIFILFEGTNYQFSKALRPVKSNETVAVNVTENVSDTLVKKKTFTVEKKQITIQLPIEKKQEEDIRSTEKAINPPVKKTIPAAEEKNIEIISHQFKAKSKNNLFSINITPPVVTQSKKVWRPSVYIFTAADGNIMIRLPEAGLKKYSITFLKEEGRPLFVVAPVKQAPMIIDKSSFLKSGWYYFELRDGEKVIERNKFLITRDN
jgi:hypothetical protein